MPPSASMMRLYSRLKMALGDLDLHDLLAHAQVDLEVLVHAPGGRRRRAFLQALLVVILLHHLVHQVADPGADRLDHHLRAFFFQEAEHVEVAVALGGLRPEFAGDLDDGLHAGAVDGDRGKAVAHFAQRGHHVVAEKLVQELAQVFRGAREPRLAQNSLARLAVAASRACWRRITSCSSSMDSSRTRSVSPAFTS